MAEAPAKSCAAVLGAWGTGGSQSQSSPMGYCHEPKSCKPLYQSLSPKLEWFLCWVWPFACRASCRGNLHYWRNLVLQAYQKKTKSTKWLKWNWTKKWLQADWTLKDEVSNSGSQRASTLCKPPHSCYEVVAYKEESNPTRGHIYRQNYNSKSEVSQKEKNKCHMLTHIYGIWKNGTDEPICRAGIETQT